MILTADSGSTKTTWKIEMNDETATVRLFQTQGINPFYMQRDEIRGVIGEELVGKEVFPEPELVTDVYFYGAGCTKEKSLIVREVLKDVFPCATTVEVDSDMFGAAKALFGNEEGIACILGTGANSCLYDGKRIVCNVSPMGYILGDEGSGAVLGRTFLNLLYKDNHPEWVKKFENETGLTQTAIIEKVYRGALPNRFLASLAPFVSAHIDEPWIENMVVDSFRLFFKRNVSHYNRADLSCSFVGSIAYYFESQLRKAAELEGYSIGEVRKEPLTC